MADSVILINCNNTVVKADVDNFTGVGLTSSSVPASNSTNLHDSVKISKEPGQLYATTSVYQKAQRIDSITKSSDFTEDFSRGIVYIDISANNVTCTWDTTKGSNWCVTYVIKAISGSYKFYITTDTGTETLSGNTLPFDTGAVLYQSLTIHYNGTNLYII